MVPHKINSKVWPGLVTKEKTMKYPTSAICTVLVCVCVCVATSAGPQLITLSHGQWPLTWKIMFLHLKIAFLPIC